MLFREYIDMVLNETDNLKDAVEDAKSIEDVSKDESGAMDVPKEDIPKDAVDVDKSDSEDQSKEIKFMMNGAKTVDDAWDEYDNYQNKVKAAVGKGGIGGGKFYTLGITSLAKGKLGNASFSNIKDGEDVKEPTSKKDLTEKRNAAFLLISQCRVKEIGVMEGFYKKFVLGARISLVGDNKEKKIANWLLKVNSRIEKENHKFKHIKTASQDFSDKLGENEFAVPIHWIPRLREVIESEISRKHKDDADVADQAVVDGENYTSPKTLHVKAGYEAKVKVPGRNTFKLPAKGTKQKLGKFGSDESDEEE